MSQRHRETSLPEEDVQYVDIFGRDSGDEDHDDDGDGGDDSDDEDDDDDDESGDEESTPAELQAENDRLTEENARLTRRMKGADRAKTKAVQELADVRKNGDKDAATLRTRVEELEAQLAAAQGTDSKTQIREAFTDSSEHDWHNRATAFALLNLDDVEVVDGKVDSDSLKDAIADLVKEHPYLVKAASEKQSDEDEGDDDEKDDAAQRRTASGNRGSGRRRGSDKAANRKELEKHFPLLRTRS